MKNFRGLNVYRELYHKFEITIPLKNPLFYSMILKLMGNNEQHSQKQNDHLFK